MQENLVALYAIKYMVIYSHREQHVEIKLSKHFFALSEGDSIMVISQEILTSVMMTSSNGNIFRVTAQSPVNFPRKGQ